MPAAQLQRGFADPLSAQVLATPPNDSEFQSCGLTSKQVKQKDNNLKVGLSKHPTPLQRVASCFDGSV